MACCGPLLYAVAAWSQQQIGAVRIVVNDVVATRPSEREGVVLQPGRAVVQNDVVDAAANSAASLIFQDNTGISIGPLSEIVLDRVVYNPSPSKSIVGFSLPRGVIRFSSGELPKTAYEIDTPSATIRLHGTVLTITVSARGATTVSVATGSATVTGAGHAVTVAAGQSTLVLCGASPTPPVATSPAPPIVTEMDRLLRTAAAQDFETRAAARSPAVEAPPDAGTHTVQAHAQFLGPYPPGAFYLGPEGGWTQLTSQRDKFTVPGPLSNTRARPEVSYNSEFNAGVRGGYMWGPWRFEEEYSYRFNSVSFFSPFFGGAHVDGNCHSNSIMTNVIHDFTLGWPITPHIGVGIGAVNINDSVDAVGVVRQPTNLTFNYSALNGNTWTFGYQGIAGVRYLINPALALDIDYRYLATTNYTINTSGPRVTGDCCRGINYKTGYNTQNVVASLTMMFGAPPPPPPPVPPSVPPPPPTHQVYLVFFDWDKYNITLEGMQILEAAAAHYKAGGAVQIQVTGYTDLTGSPGYNQRLSERRAGAVAAVLERLGVPRNEMIVAGRGMDDPRVPTPLGVREPQNWRVEIVFPNAC